MSNYINIEGARVNNLKNISLKIPRGKMVVVTGLSGSGKSSLAFDTLFAEGQRRFAESLSSFARQFLGRMSKPAVDKIEGIPPAIAIEQKVNSRNPRSTVGTTTEIYDYLRVLFAKIGKTYSPISGKEVKCYNVQDVVKFISKEVEDVNEKGVIYILSKISWVDDNNQIEQLLNIKELGYNRLFSNEKMVRLDSVISNLNDYINSPLYLMIDRQQLSPDIKEINNQDITRLSDSIQTAFKEGGGVVTIAININNSTIYHTFSNIFEADGITFSKPTELLFSYNNPIGACSVCNGNGNIMGIDESLVIPNKSLSVYEGAIACWKGEVMGKLQSDLIYNAHKFNFPIHKPYMELTPEQRELLWNGNEYFMGITDFFKEVERLRYKIQFKYMLLRYSGKTICKECNGTRLRKEANYVKIGGKSISELMNMSINSLSTFLNNLQLDSYDLSIAKRAITEINSRLNYIKDVGLGYLTLNRASNTLSGGESQRINLVSSLGSSLVGSLYILDEPSIGLHHKDTAKLISVLKKLRDLGNTLLIVEHDEEIIRAADELIDIGPYAGVNGGEVVFQGVVDSNTKPNGKSLTLDYLLNIKRIETPPKRRAWKEYIEIKGAMEHNLKKIDVKFPLGVITAVTGVSGSGKSTLIGETLYPALARHFQQFGMKVGAYKELSGSLSKLKGVEFVDQNPIGKSSRSNPVTYLKIYDDIRKLYSEQQYAKINGFGHSHFSFNIDGGRCPQCLGDGFITIPMQFMADVKMVCSECNGKRFKSAVLDVKYKGKSICDILDMSVKEAIEFFNAQKETLAKRIANRLQVLDEVGLGYIKLGQNSSSLSGGECQRIKLAHFLSKDKSGTHNIADSTLFIFDEPTTGLHFHDIKKLLAAFNALVDRGNTIIVIEHNKDVIKSADWMIELGPEGGENGGNICYCGEPI